MTTTTRRTRKAATTTTEPAKPKRTRRAAATPVAEPVKAERGPRGELLSRHGAVLDGKLAGFVVGLAFAEFELAKHPDQAGWVTVCTAHGTSTPAANKGEAEKAGARKARQTWCRQCAKAAKA